MVFLFGIGAYSTFIAKASSDRLKQAHAIIAELSDEKTRLASSDTATALKLEEAVTAREQAESALKQSRVDADAAAVLGRELQKRLKAAQANAEAVRASAAASKKEAERAGADAARANAAFTQVRNLQERVADLKSEADAAREAKASLERELAALKSELADMRQKLDAAAPTASTGR